MSSAHTVRQGLDNADIDPDLTWTTGNVAEAFPGVFTTLGFTFIDAPMELAFRKIFVRLDVFPPTQGYLPDRAEDMFWTVFDGRAAANIDKFREIACLTPGTSATAVEQQLFGIVRPETVDANSIRRYRVIIAKVPRLLAGLPRRHDRLFTERRSWRLHSLGRVDDLDRAGCLALLADTRSRFEEIMLAHLVVALVSSGLAEKVTDALTALGKADLESTVLSGVGADENDVAHDLWALAHEQITVTEFRSRHGYHGSNEDQLSGVSWREDPSPILARLPDYRAISADDPRAPRIRSARQATSRDQAMSEIFAASYRSRWPAQPWTDRRTRTRNSLRVWHRQRHRSDPGRAIGKDLRGQWDRRGTQQPDGVQAVIGTQLGHRALSSRA